MTRLDRSLRAWASALARAGSVPIRDLPGAGAGGGLEGGAVAGLRAHLHSGFDLLSTVTGLDGALAAADLAITGEGSLDAQSLDGKVPVGVAAAARTRGARVLVVAGRVALDEAALADAGIWAAGSLVDRASSSTEARARAAELVRAETARLVECWRAAHHDGHGG